MSDYAILHDKQRYVVCPCCGFKKIIEYMHVFCFDCEAMKYVQAGYTGYADADGIRWVKHEVAEVKSNDI